jgi:methionyl-tRNA formyltransferase
MNYIFFGTPQFAALILEKMLGANLLPAAVVCNPDKPVGRKKIVTPPPVKQIVMNSEPAIRDNIKILQPLQLDKGFIHSLSLIRRSFDLFIVAAYAKILLKEILAIPSLGVIGVHPSLLPKYRGPSPIQSALLNGEKETGVSLFLMDEEMDHGPIIAQRSLAIDDSFLTASQLETKLADLGGELLLQTLPRFLRGDIVLQPQAESLATYTKKFTAADAYLSPADLSEALAGGNQTKALLLFRKIRAFNPEPGAWTMLNNKRVKILEAQIIDSRLKLIKIQQEGKKPVFLP